MRKKILPIRLFLFLAALAFLAGCGPPATLPRSTPENSTASNGSSDSRPADFAFQVKIQTCVTDTYDSATGIYTQDMGPDKPPATVQIPLTTTELDAIYEAATAIQFSSYPAEYVSADAGNTHLQTFIQYTLTITGNGVGHSVTWALGITTDQTQQSLDLDGLYRAIMNLIQSKPEYKSLPDRGFGCM
jgi:hypothetical protein